MLRSSRNCVHAAAHYCVSKNGAQRSVGIDILAWITSYEALLLLERVTFSVFFPVCCRVVFCHLCWIEVFVLAAAAVTTVSPPSRRAQS